MSFHLGASQQAFPLTLDRNSAGETATTGANLLCVSRCGGAFQSLGATLLGFIRGGEGLPNDCQEGGIWGRSFRTQSCLSPFISLAVLWALTWE